MEPAESAASVAQTAPQAKDTRVLSLGETVRGSITTRAGVLTDGTYFEPWELSGEPDGLVAVEMSSSAFDTYLLAIDSNGQVLAENDDEATSTNSRLLFRMPEDGLVTILANTVLEGVTGSYEVQASMVEEAPDNEVANAPVSGALVPDRPINSELSSDRPRFADGSHFEVWEFQASAGQTATVAMESTDLDAFLVLADSDGQVLEENDDADGSNASIVFIAPATGTYRVYATTYNADQVGEYRLRLTVPPPVQFGSSGAPSDQYALLVSIADYPGDGNDLPGAAGDAVAVRRLLEDDLHFKPSNILQLTDAQATRANLIRAFSSLLAQADSSGSIVFYYSGHGTQIDSNAMLSGPLDPEEDGRDEAIVLYDGLMLDDEIGTLLGRLRTDRVLVVFDSCFSGTATRGVPGLTKEIATADLTVGLPKSLLGSKVPKSMPVDSSVRYEGFTRISDHVFLSASAEDQLAWVGPDEMKSSVFTYFFVDVLRQADRRSSWKDIMSRIGPQTARVVQDVFGELQQPQIAGDAAESAIEYVLYR